VIKKKYTTDGSEIVLLTDGEDNTISGCTNEVKQSGAIIHTVALGPSAAKELEELSKMTGKGSLSLSLHRAPLNQRAGEGEMGRDGVISTN
jgi:uncharacterized protein with von Willebrand factor type A (vWA) domain